MSGCNNYVVGNQQEEIECDSQQEIDIEIKRRKGVIPCWSSSNAALLEGNLLTYGHQTPRASPLSSVTPSA